MQRRATRCGKTGFGFAVDDLELEPDPLGDAGAEIFAIDGGAAGFSRDQASPRRALVPHLVAANGQGLDGARDRRLADAAGG